MKTLIVSLTIFSSFAILTEAGAALDSTAPGGAPGQPPAPQSATAPTVNPTVNNTAFPWQTGAGINPARLSRLLADLQDDIGTAIPRLATLNGNADYDTSGTQPVDSSAAHYVTANDVLPAKDLSTLASQNLSANLGQNLATSLAVPTAAPWSTWGNGPGMVLADVGGAVVAVPTLPPRTAWGNGPGAVVTTAGGAVYSLVPGPMPVANANAGAAREVLRQLSIVQEDLDRVLRYLATVNTNAVAPASPASPPVYLTPTGR
jgi:hypothetical protein